MSNKINGNDLSTINNKPKTTAKIYDSNIIINKSQENRNQQKQITTLQKISGEIKTDTIDRENEKIELKVMEKNAYQTKFMSSLVLSGDLIVGNTITTEGIIAKRISIDNEILYGKTGPRGPKGIIGPTGATGAYPPIVNIGDGIGIYKMINDNKTEFKTIKGCDIMNLENNENEIVLSISQTGITGTGPLIEGSIQPGFGKIDINQNKIKCGEIEIENGSKLALKTNISDLSNGKTWMDKKSTIIEHNDTNGISSIVLNNEYIQINQSFANLGVIFSDSDNNTKNSYNCYVNSSGILVSSSKDKKYSIIKKEHKNYLERINSLNIYSYAQKYQIDDNDSIEKKNRKILKMKKTQIGLMAEEVENIFDNATDLYKKIDIDEKNNTDFNILSQSHNLENEDDFINKKNNDRDGPSIKYDALLCYTILALQELTKKQQKDIEELRKEIEYLKNNK
jgi:hypothetical protein